MNDCRDRPPDPVARHLHPPHSARDPLGPWLWMLAAGWTLFVGLALLWNMAHIRESARDLALVSARFSIEKDLLYSRWLTMHGSVRTSGADMAPLAPRPADAPGRAAPPPPGGALTPRALSGAATAEARDPGKELAARLGHITSLKPLRPENAPDVWERAALRAFERGAPEATSLEIVGGEPHLRLMQPVRAAAGCLKCHAAQGYAEGSICGGISVAVPMKNYEAIVRPHQRAELLAHGIIWALGLVSFGAGSRQMQKRRRERDEAQAAVQDGERRFRAIFEDSPVAIWEEDFSGVKKRLDELRRAGVTDFRAYFRDNPGEVAGLLARVRVIEVNEASVRAFGAVTRQQVVRDLPRYITTESLEVFREEIVALAEGATRFRSETLRLTMEGNPVAFDLTLSVEQGYEDTLERVLVSFVNVTERRRAEDALRESEARMNKAQEIAHVGSWELDLSANRLTWSDEAYRIFGTAPGDGSMTFEAFLDAVHPDDRAAVNAAYSASIRDGNDSYEIEHRLVRKSTGEIRHVREKCQHLRDASGRIVRSVGMVHDITESRRAENELRARNEELTRFNRVATNRELRMVELKREINELCSKAGEPPRYSLNFSERAPKE